MFSLLLFLAVRVGETMKPFLSIVIANYNYGRFLDEAIQSVLSQSCQDFEIIIIDGGSTDDSVEVIRKYTYSESGSKVEGEQRSSKISYWVSEKDKGQSDAFNKGFAKARGRFLAWLNADDVMLPGTVERLKRAAEKNPECEWFVGGCVWTDPSLNVIRCTRARSFSRTEVDCGLMTVYSPSSFFASILLKRVGAINLDYHFMMDTELWLRFYHDGHATYRALPGYVFALRLHPDAKMSGHNFASSPMADAENPARVKRRLECAALRGRFPCRSIPLWHRLFGRNWVLIARSRLDTLRFGSKPLKYLMEERS